MIRSIRIHCFQPHVRFDINLDPNVTVLCGESDQGKSAALRALRWVCCNSIRGDSFITHGEETARVEVDLEEDTIVRQTGKGGNFYQVNDGELYKSFRNDVPEDIAKLLNVDDTLNFQGQLDPPYWLSLSSGEVSRELNRIVNLERIDQVLSHCAGEIRKTKAALQVSEERLAKAREERDRLSWVVEAHREYERITSVQDSIAAKTHTFDVLREAIGDTELTRKVVYILSEAVKDGSVIISVMNKVEKDLRTVSDLQDAIKEAEVIESEITYMRKHRNELEKELTNNLKGKCPVCGGDYER